MADVIAIDGTLPVAPLEPAPLVKSAAPSLAGVFGGLWQKVRQRGMALLLALLVLGTLLTGVQLLQRAADDWERQGVLVSIGTEADVRKLDELLLRQRRGEAGVEPQIQALRRRLSSRLDTVSHGSLLSPFTFVRLLCIVAALLLLLAGLCYGLLWEGQDAAWSTLLLQTPRRLPPLSATVGVMFLFSLLWIPGMAILLTRFHLRPVSDLIETSEVLLVFAGYFTAVLFGPRMVLAPVATVMQEQPPFAALRWSMQRTLGHWGLVLGAVFLCVCAPLLTFFPLILAAVRVAGSDSAAVILFQAFALQATATFVGAGIAHLACALPEAPPIPSAPMLDSLPVPPEEATAILADEEAAEIAL
jgi:hypothetical protein